MQAAFAELTRVEFTELYRVAWLILGDDEAGALRHSVDPQVRVDRDDTGRAPDVSPAMAPTSSAAPSSPARGSAR